MNTPTLEAWLAEEQARPKPTPTAITNGYGLSVRELPPPATLARLDALAAQWCEMYQATRVSEAWELHHRALLLLVCTHSGERLYVTPIVRCGFAGSDDRYGEELTVEPCVNNWRCNPAIVPPRPPRGAL